MIGMQFFAPRLLTLQTGLLDEACHLRMCRVHNTDTNDDHSAVGSVVSNDIATDCDRHNNKPATFVIDVTGADRRWHQRVPCEVEHDYSINL